MACYAWGVLERLPDVPVGITDDTLPVELLAQVLARETDRLIRRGLPQDYAEVEADLDAPRGRIDWPQTLGRGRGHPRRLTCVVEHRSPDTPLNRLLRASLLHATGLDGIRPSTRADLWQALGRFPATASITPSESAFAAIRLDRLTLGARLALQVANMLVTGSRPLHDGRSHRFDGLRADEARMGTFFQAFVREFLRYEVPGIGISAERLCFDAPTDRPAWLPQMATDLVLRNVDGSAEIVELKCVRHTLQHHYDAVRLRSDHLYQLLTYLETARRQGWNLRGGTLLYAESEEGPLHLERQVNGHRIRVRSLPLHQRWEEVCAALHGLCADLLPSI